MINAFTRKEKEEHLHKLTHPSTFTALLHNDILLPQSLLPLLPLDRK